MNMLKCLAVLTLIGVCGAGDQRSPQPVVQPGPSEPDLLVLLDRRHGLSMTDDLRNPVKTTPDAVPALFRKAGDGPVKFVPELALGLEVTIRGGYYERRPGNASPVDHALWSYQHKHTGADMERDTIAPVPLAAGSATEFDPGRAHFGLWIGNDQFNDRVFTEPGRVRSDNKRLASQPYKVMIYPYRNPVTKRPVAHSYLLCWEYSTNDDFQDVVCRIENVELISQ